MIIRRMVLSDAEKYRKMETGLEHDYVRDMLEYMIENDNMYMAEEEDGTLLAVCRLEKMMDGYGFLGSARTNICHRGKGIHTRLTSYVIEEAKREGIRWIGLTTDEVNTAVHKMMDKLGFIMVGKSAACVLKKDIKIDKPSIIDREVYDKTCDKRRILENELNRYDRRFFHYSPYFGLPYRHNAITDQYLNDLKVIRTGSNYYFIMDIDWGDGFKTRQMHYYGGSVLNCREIIDDFLYHYGDKSEEFEEIWIEVLDAKEHDIDEEYFKNIRGWRLYGMDI